jgi:hypothetical protein
MLARDTVCKKRWSTMMLTFDDGLILKESGGAQRNEADAVESLGGFAQPRCANYWANQRDTDGNSDDKFDWVFHSTRL